MEVVSVAGVSALEHAEASTSRKIKANCGRINSRLLVWRVGILAPLFGSVFRVPRLRFTLRSSKWLCESF